MPSCTPSAMFIFLCIRYEQCGCVSPNEWASRYVIPLGSTSVIHARLCETSDSCYSDAMTEFQSSAALTLKYASSCRIKCSTNDFVVKTSSSAAPVRWYIDEIKQFVESSSIPTPPSNDSVLWATRIATNYVGLVVLCESTVVESYTQQATMSVVDVVSNIGGQTGLWIGISFLSLIEFAEMFYRLIRHTVHATRRKLLS